MWQVVSRLPLRQAVCVVPQVGGRWSFTELVADHHKAGIAKIKAAAAAAEAPPKPFRCPVATSIKRYTRRRRCSDHPHLVCLHVDSDPAVLAAAAAVAAPVIANNEARRPPLVNHVHPNLA